MMDEVMYEIREMTGQEYVHHYHGQEPGRDDEPLVARQVATVTDIATRTPSEGVERKLVAVAGG